MYHLTNLVVTSPRGYSIKIRIKTLVFPVLVSPIASPRGYSSKRRIKTTDFVTGSHVLPSPRGYSIKRSIKTNYPHSVAIGMKRPERIFH